MDNSKGPIFIIGSYRSATSVLTWCLGQHPNILPLEETHFIYKLSADLHYLYQIGTNCEYRSCLGLMGTSRKGFYEFFGESINNLINDSKSRLIRNVYSPKFAHLRTQNIELIRSENDPKQRWIDGTPENSHYVYSLNKIFPDAKFIHILRNPKQVVTSLMHFSSLGQADYPEEEAYRTWIRLVSDCFLAEKAFGTNKVLRVIYEDIVNRPKYVIERCLDFVGEAFNEDCLLPLNEKVNSSKYKVETDYSIETNINSEKSYIREAFSLYKTILDEGNTRKKVDISALKVLKRKYLDFCNSIRPDTNNNLSIYNQSLEKEISEKNKKIEQLQNQLKVLTSPMTIEAFGPEDITAGVDFNTQTSGDSAIWIRSKNATATTIVVLNECNLSSSVSEDGTLVTAVVPKDLYEFAGNYSMYLLDINTLEKSNTVSFIIK